MEIQTFIERFADVVEIEDVNALTPETLFHDLDEWSSISVMLMIAFFDEEFGKELTTALIDHAQTIRDLYDLAHN